MASDSSTIDFLQACGCNSPLSVEVVDAKGSSVEQQVLPTPCAVIGREQGLDLFLDHEQVSRRHAFLQVLAGQAFCFDMESRTGTRWSDGRRFSGWIKPNEPIHVGPYELRVRAGEETAGVTWDPLQPCSPELLPDVPVTLEFLNGATHKRCWQIDRVLTLVGSAPGCKVRLRSRSTGRFHGYLAATPTGIWVVDLLSTAGIFRNGEQVRFARLEDGDQLLIGSFLIRCHHGEFKATATVSKIHQRATAAHYDPARETVPVEPTSSRPAEFTGSALALRLPVHGAMTPADEDRFLVVMNQFSLMQMQMFDQFQQTMMMMFQMFGTLQQEQVAVLREEMDQVRELTKELQTLQESLARAEQTSEPARQSSEGYETPPAEPQGPTPFSPNPPTPSTSAPANGNSAPFPSAKGFADGKKTGDLHSLLFKRMENIEQERQNRWQKILGLLGAKKQ